MAKVDAKEIGLNVLLGAGVIVGTGLLSGFVDGIEFMATSIIPDMLTVGTALAAGVSAFLVNMAIEKWLR